MSANQSTRLDAKFRQALDLHQQGYLQRAHKLYRSVLKARPDHPGALHYLGLLSHQQGKSDLAERLIRKAIHHRPDYIDAIMNLGNVLQEQGSYTVAEKCYRQVINQNPAEAAAHSNLSVTLRRQGRLEEAISTGRHAAELDPSYLIAWFNLGNAYKVAGQYKKAVIAYEQAIRLKPDFSLAHDGYCQCTFQLEKNSLLGRLSFAKSIRAYEQWLACEPDNALADFMLQAIRGDEQLTRAPDSVVRTMFNQFADNFEQHLDELEYSLPERLGPILQELLGPPKGVLKVLDGGCGTGLCAPVLKPWASQLTGVDLSAGMLEKAREKQCYDILAESELSGFLGRHHQAFDLMVYADTLCYFGDLNKVINASAHALRAGGLLLFSLEASSAKDSSKTFQLHPRGRYSHTQNYVRDVLEKFGFTDISISPESMRKEVDVAVEGLMVSARK